jgi:glutaredoxin
MRVTLYTKPGCHLCDDALAMLDRLAPLYNLEVDEVNILDDTALYEAYRNDIPVVAIEGGRLGTLRAPIDEAGLRTALEVASRAYPQPNAAGSVLHPRRREREPLIDRVARYIGRHWLRLVVIALGIYVLLPWLAPLFAAFGWWDLADPIYTAYALTCHQRPERAGSVFGYQVGFF